MQRDNHSRQSTIARTASKLQPFPFNEAQEPSDHSVLRGEPDNISAACRIVMSYEVEQSGMSPESPRQRRERQDRRAQEEPSEGGATLISGSSDGSTGTWLHGLPPEGDVSHACVEESCGCESAATREPCSVPGNGLALSNALTSLGLGEAEERLCAVCREPFHVRSRSPQWPEHLAGVSAPGTPPHELGNGEAAADGAPSESFGPTAWSQCFCHSCLDSLFLQPGEGLPNTKAIKLLQALPTVMRSRVFS